MRHRPLTNTSTREQRGRPERVSIARVAWVCVLASLLVLGSFGGVSFFAHAHDEHGLHFHAASTETKATRPATLHVEHHRAHSHDAHSHDHACILSDDVVPSRHGETSHTEQTEPVDGVLVSLPDCDVVRVQPTAVPQFPTLVGEVISFGLCVLTTSIQVAPGTECVETTRPQHLSGLCSCARIVRTSGALLI